MVGVTVRRNTLWMGPTPLWAKQSTAGLQVANNGANGAAAAPQILRFANDDFMEEFMGVLASDPRKISDYVLQRKETWRNPITPPQKMPYPENETSISKLLKRTRSKADLKKVTTDKVIVSAKSASEPPAHEGGGRQNLKLYQPGHQRYYLVSAALISNEFGLPDQAIKHTQQEKVSFVVRRLLPPYNPDDPYNKNLSEDAVPNSSWSEHAFIKGDRGNVWKKIGHYALDSGHLMANEDQMPMFPSGYAGDCCNRILYSGTIPVARREQWMSAPEESGDPSLALPPTLGKIDSLAKAVFIIDVAEPWRALINKAAHVKGSMNRSFAAFPKDDDDDDSADRKRMHNNVRDQIQTGSWYILLDFADFLRQHLSGVWDVINGDAALASLPARQQDFYRVLDNTTFNSLLSDKIARAPISAFKASLTQALKEIIQYRDKLENVSTPLRRYSENLGTTQAIREDLQENWPEFIFPFADPEHPTAVPPAGTGTLADNAVPDAAASDAERDKEKLDGLVELLSEILPKDSQAQQGDIPLQTSLLDNKRGWFVIRCVYQRPNCGPLFPALVSRPTRVLQMAPFFDPEAPARPIRIPMPMDISPAGLRKYSKNTGFILSDMLCGGVKKMRGYSLGDLVLSVLPWPFHKDLPDPGDSGPCKDKGGLEFGMICSLSIPIVTLCAFILLMIMVALFDLFFRWIPYLMVCLPIPGLKGKN